MKYGIALVSLLLFSACGDDDPDNADNPAPGKTFAEQATSGSALYGQHCASCHGADGSGTSLGPAVVGMGVLPLDPPAGAARNVQFRTALDVFQWVKVNMPGDDPGSLTDSVYVEILAFDLQANGVSMDVPLDASSAADLVLNP